jgi:hypothetical protein
MNQLQKRPTARLYRQRPSSRLYRRQRGATFIGMVTIIAILGLALYAGIRLTPIYLEYMKVVRSMEQTRDEAKGGPPDPAAVRVSLDRRWAIEDISTIDAKDIEVKKSGDGVTMRAFYRAEAPFVGNVSLAVDFDKSVVIPSTQSP